MKPLTYQDLLEIIDSAETRDHADFKTRRVWNILRRSVLWHQAESFSIKTASATEAGKTNEESGPPVSRQKADLGDIG